MRHDWGQADAWRRLVVVCWLSRGCLLQLLRFRLLCREFEVKNPMIAQHDNFNFFEANPDSLAARFAEKQIAEMKKGLLRH